MNSSNSSSMHLQDDSESQAEPNINVPMTNEPSFSEDRYKFAGQYMKVLSKDQRIDEEAILQEYNNSLNLESKSSKKLRKGEAKKKKVQLKPSSLSKKFSFGQIRKKWRASIDESVETYKQRLKEIKTFDSKQKESLLDLYKILIDGIFELRNYAESNITDLTGNEKKLISEDADIITWIGSLVQSFYKELKEAEVNNRIQSWKRKWDALVKNCKDQNNFQLRRKIIRCRVKPINVIENDDNFFMSQDAKFEQERLKRLILAEAAKDFQRPHIEESQKSEIEQISGIVEEPQIEITPLPSKQSLGSQRQKKEEYQAFLSQLFEKVKSKITSDLQGHPSYQRVMRDFTTKFTLKIQNA